VVMNRGSFCGGGGTTAKSYMKYDVCRSGGLPTSEQDD
jgi:hypothetical protein